MFNPENDMQSPTPADRFRHEREAGNKAEPAALSGLGRVWLAVCVEGCQKKLPSSQAALRHERKKNENGQRSLASSALDAALLC